MILQSFEWYVRRVYKAGNMAYLLLSFYITFITIDFTRKSLFHAAKYRNFVAKNKLESINGLESNYANNSTINTWKYMEMLLQGQK